MTHHDIAQAGEQAADLHVRLAWRYTPERADRAVNGADRATQIDLARWRTLGSRRRQA